MRQSCRTNRWGAHSDRSSSGVFWLPYRWLPAGRSCALLAPHLFGLKTEPSESGRVRRAAIRETWGNIAHYSHYPAQVVFLLGTTAVDQLEHQLEEEEEEDDLLVGDFVDSFHNLTYKDSLFFTWMKHECPSATYAFKGDDDIFVNPFELEKLVSRENERQGRISLDSW